MATCQISSFFNTLIWTGGLGLIVLCLIRVTTIALTGSGERRELQSAA